MCVGGVGGGGCVRALVRVCFCHALYENVDFFVCVVRLCTTDLYNYVYLCIVCFVVCFCKL